MVAAPFLKDHDLSLLIVPLRVREDNPGLQAKTFVLFLRHDAGTKLQRQIPPHGWRVKGKKPVSLSLKVCL